MAEHPNAALIRRMYAALSAGDYATVLREIMSDGVVWRLPGSHPVSGDHVGLEAVFAAMGRFDGAVELELHDVVANDDHAVALLRARGSRGGKQYDALEMDVFHVRDGRVTEFWSFSEDQRKTDDYWS